jgi:hypothetical protein
MTTKPAFQKILQGLLNTEDKEKHSNKGVEINRPHHRIDKQMSRKELNNKNGINYHIPFNIKTMC